MGRLVRECKDKGSRCLDEKVVGKTEAGMNGTSFASRCVVMMV